jgi:hypothetical protein
VVLLGWVTLITEMSLGDVIAGRTKGTGLRVVIYLWVPMQAMSAVEIYLRFHLHSVLLLKRLLVTRKRLDVLVLGHRPMSRTPLKWLP